MTAVCSMYDDLVDNIGLEEKYKPGTGVILWPGPKGLLVQRGYYFLILRVSLLVIIYSSNLTIT